MIIFELIGKYLCVEPFLSTGVMSSTALSSCNINVEQLMDDLSFISVVNVYDKNLMILSISLLVTLLTSMLLLFFKPFIEVYLMYYYKLSFYFLINLLSVSTIYLITRVYGYSRLYIIFYLILASLFMYVLDRKNWRKILKL